MFIFNSLGFASISFQVLFKLTIYFHASPFSLSFAGHVNGIIGIASGWSLPLFLTQTLSSFIFSIFCYIHFPALFQHTNTLRQVIIITFSLQIFVGKFSSVTVVVVFSAFPASFACWFLQKLTSNKGKRCRNSSTNFINNISSLGNEFLTFPQCTFVFSVLFHSFSCTYLLTNLLPTPWV